MTAEQLAFSPLGDRAVLITLGDQINETTHHRVRDVCDHLVGLQGITEIVPAYASVVAHYDLLGFQSTDSVQAPYANVVTRLRGALSNLGGRPASDPRTVEIPVCYGGELGPDLESVAERHGMTADDVVRLHSGAEYLVYMVGFVPGFGYLGGLPPQLATPRRSEPRTHVPTGSVGIGGSQTGVYPMVTPGGWNLIGGTPARMFDVARNPASLLTIGDRVRFRPVTLGEFESQAGRT
jgi:inhibitor of KinA